MQILTRLRDHKPPIAPLVAAPPAQEGQRCEQHQGEGDADRHPGNDGATTLGSISRRTI